MSDVPVALSVIQGVPLTVTATIIEGASLWPSGAVVIGQMRDRAGGTLILDLAPFLTSTVVGRGLVVKLHLSGRQTRLLSQKAVYDVFVQEPGLEADTAVRVLFGSVQVQLAVTVTVA